MAQIPDQGQTSSLKTTTGPDIENNQNLLVLLGSNDNNTRLNGYGFKARIDKIREVSSSDPEVNLIVRGLLKLINRPKSYATTDLASQLHSPYSISTQVVSSYLEWIAHRDKKEKAASEQDQNYLRELDPALLKTRVSAIIDMLLIRLVDLNLAIPETIEMELTPEMLSGSKESSFDLKITLAGKSKQHRQQALASIDSILQTHGHTRLEEPNESGIFCCSVNKVAALQIFRLDQASRINREIKVAESFLNLFHGGASRIQDRANSWFINTKLEDLYETEKVLNSGAEISNQELFKAVWVINELDGGTSIGYQDLLQPGQTRQVEDRIVDRNTIPQALKSSSLISMQENSLCNRERRDAYLNILQQSNNAQRAVSKMEEKIASLPPSSIEFAQSRDVLQTYTARMLYDSHALWQNQGVFDRLLEVSVTVGSQKHREAAIDFLNYGMDQIAPIIYKDLPGNYRHVYLALANLILSRENWDTKTLDFVFDKLEWLQRFKTPQEMTARRAQQTCTEIISIRREEAPENSQVLEVLRGLPEKVKIVEYASYKFKLAIKNESATGQKGKVLEVHFPETKLKEDTEELYNIHKIGELAKQEGYLAIQLVGWPYNPAKRVRDTEEYLEISTKLEGNSRKREEPIFVKELAPWNSELTNTARRSFDDYMKMQFQASLNLDLSMESIILKEDAHRFKQKHGGKAMGLAILEQLISEFADKRLQTLPRINCKPEDLLHGVKIPEEFFLNEKDFSGLICRSNAAFEYGCPPGILSSIGKLEVDRNRTLRKDLSGLQSGFKQVLNQYELDSRVSYQLLIQPQLYPRASGIVYSSFSGNKNEETIIEASLGPPISATTGLANLLHYRVQDGKVASHRNFEGETPSIIFHGKNCLIDRSEDPSRRELDLYKSITEAVKGLRLAELQSIWQANTFNIPSEPLSPLKLEELELLNKFAKFAESKLNKPLKLEFGVADDGTIYILQLDPATLEVDESSLTFNNEDQGIIIETPFVNMPLNADGLDVLVEIAAGTFTKIPENKFLFVSETTPLNINIHNDLAKPFPQCLGIITASGSRMNHCYSEARTYIPMLGFINIGEALRKVMPDLQWGHNPGLKMDIRSNGRWGRLRIYQDHTA